MSCEVFNESDFGMIEWCEQTFSINLYNIFGEEYTNVIIDFVEWRMSKYGETELIVSKKTTDGSISVNENIITISIFSKDKIQLLFNILNSMSFTGIQQAQAIAQISVILGDPITENKTIDIGY